MKKALIGTFAGIALLAGTAGTTAFAKGTEARVDADARVETRNGGIGSRLGAFIGLHGGDQGERTNKDKDGNRFEDRKDDRQDRGRKDERSKVNVDGSAEIQAISNDRITAIGWGGVIWTVSTDSDTRFVVKGDKDADIDSLSVGSVIAFKGDVTDNDGDERSVDADAVFAWKTSDKARVSGTIESVNEADGTVVVSTDRGDVEVAVDADTSIRTEDQEDGSFSDLLVGAEVRVKGMWETFANAMTAVKVRILG